MSVDLSNYHLTFDDEFNTFSRNIPGGTHGTWDTAFNAEDPTNVVRTLTGNGEQEVYIEPEYKNLGLNPFTDQNGVLTMTANPAPSADFTALGGYKYTSGMITTQYTWSQEYGYFEMRAQLPAGQGSWPAFWMLPVHSGGGEVDIFEQLGNNPNVVHQTIHDPGAAGGGGQMYDTSVQSNNGFHTYGFQWTPTTMTFYVDGQQTGTRANTINQSMYLISNLALGGTWGGPVDATTPFPLNMNIDYIRAYSNNPNIPAVGPNPPPSTTQTPPVANNDSGFTTAENTAISIPASALLANDSDPDGDTLTITGVSNPANGTVSLSTQSEVGGQTVQFTPTSGYTGPAGFTYAITDGQGFAASANVALAVSVPPPPPPPPPPANSINLLGTNTPGVITDPDQQAAELGVKFQSSQAGTVTGIRFYKGPLNTGTHTGELWDSGGHQLATATFTNETSSGWQDVSFSSPVSISPNTTYIASYHENNGHYSSDDTYYTTAHTSGPLTALADGSTPGGNGVYILGNSAFPTVNYEASNYWVDVDFSPSATPPPSSGPADTLVLNLSEDYYRGDARAQLFVDGKAYGTQMTVTASHAAGNIQHINVSLASIVAGLHTIGVEFMNDKYNGTATTDRNLYVNPIQVGTQTAAGITNATTYGSGTQALYSTGDMAKFPSVLITH